MFEELDYEDWIVLLEDEIHDLINDKVEFETAMTNAWRFNQEYEYVK
jgi:hypothetical protein